MDIANLFTPQESTAAFAQGVLLSFDTNTGLNTVNVNGAIFTNLPLLNVPDVINMAAGSVVMLAQYGGSYAIVGRVVVPSSALLNTSAINFQSDNSQASVTGFGLTTSFATQGTLTFTTPAWANQAFIIATAQASAVNSTASNDDLHCICDINGTGGGEQRQWAAPNATTGGFSASVTAANNGLLTGLTGGFTITVNCRLRTGNASWASSSSNIANAHANVIFTRV